MSRGGDALMAQAGISTEMTDSETSVITVPPVPVASSPVPEVSEDLMLRYVPGRSGVRRFRRVREACWRRVWIVEGEAGDVTITIGDGVFVIYNSNTGHVRVDSSRTLSSVEIVSKSGIFTGSPAANLGGPFDVDTDVKIFKLSALTTGGSPVGFANIDFGAVAQKNLTDSFVRRDLTIAGSLVPNGGLSSKTVRVEVFATDLNGNRISEISNGQEFELRATVRDVRATAFQTGGNVGVFAAYFDVEWDADLADAVGQPIFAQGFSNAKSGTLGDGFLDEVGAISSSTTPTDTNAQLMFRQRMRATSGGESAVLAQRSGHPAAARDPRIRWYVCCQSGGHCL